MKLLKKENALFEFNKYVKERKAITLIALIITIIILLILAGVTITTLTNENGILNRAKEAKQKQEETESLENLKLLIDNVSAEIISNNITGNETYEYLNKEIETIDRFEISTLSIEDGNTNIPSYSETEFVYITDKKSNLEYKINNTLEILSINGTEIKSDESNISQLIDYWTLDNTLENSAQGTNSGSLTISSGTPVYEDGGIRLNKDAYVGPYAELATDYTLPEKYTITIQTKQTSKPIYGYNSIFSIYSGENDFSNTIIFGIYDTNNTQLLYGNGANYSTATREVSLNEWHTFVVTNDGEHITYYMDNIQFGQVDTFIAKSRKITIGGSKNVRIINGTSMIYKNLAIYNYVVDINTLN